MKVSELIERLKELPQEADVAYFHNVSGVISVEEIEHREPQTLGGKKLDIIVLCGAKEN